MKKSWTKEQLEIFRYFAEDFISKAKDVVVRAFAGTGKTSTVTEALLNHCVAVKGNKLVLCTTFARKNRMEMQSLFADSGVTVLGIHQIGLRILGKFWRKRLNAHGCAEYKRALRLFPSCPKQVAIVASELVGFLKNTYLMPTLADVVKTINEREIVVNGDTNADWEDKLPEIALAVLKESLDCPKDGLISFEDMFWVPTVLGIIRPEYDLIVIDEAQDSNIPQMTMLYGLRKPNGIVVLVGDNHQAIYYFRGSMSNCLDFYKEQRNAKEFGLSESFRCGKAIVPEVHDLVPTFKANDGNAEGKVETLPKNKALALAEVGKDVIISRVNAPLMPVCLDYIRNGKPARIEGRDIGKQLKGIVESLNAKDTVELVSKLGVWAQVRLSKLSNWDSSAKAQAINDQYETIKVLADDCNTVAEVLYKLETLFQDSDGNQKPAIVLSSTHKAKGLEWPRVILFKDTFLRNSGNLSRERETEEQNLLYVAKTRAREHLVYTSAN